MPVTIDGSNTPTAGGVVYGDGTAYASTAAGTSGQVLLSNGSSAPTWGTAGTSTTATNLAGGSAGTVPYQSAAGTTAMLAAGTSGQVLTSSGAGAPSWTTPSAGALVYISTTTVSSPVASVDITSGFSSTYDDYVILFEDVVFSGSSVNIYLRMYKNSSLITSSTYLTQRLLSTNATTTSSTNSAVTASQFGVGRSDAQTFGEIRVFNANSANVSLLTRVSCLGGGESSIYQMSIRNTASNSLTGISLYDTSGTYNFTSGTFRLYGVAKS